MMLETMEQWRMCDFDDTAWGGPFPDRNTALRALNVGIAHAGWTRDDDTGEIVYVPLVRTGTEWWAGMPACLVVGPQRFLVELAFDPDDEWGAPIGYNVFPIEDRDGRPHVGPPIREIREEAHPDSGAQDGAIAEVTRRAGRSVDERDFEEIGIDFR